MRKFDEAIAALRKSAADYRRKATDCAREGSPVGARLNSSKAHAATESALFLEQLQLSEDADGA